MAQHAALTLLGLNPDQRANGSVRRVDDDVNWSGLEGMSQPYAQGGDALRPCWLVNDDPLLRLQW